MDCAAIRELADYLMSLPEGQPEVGFNMDTFLGSSSTYRPDRSGHNCGTVACIAGHVWLRDHPEEPRDMQPGLDETDEMTIAEYARGVLGLNEADGAALFLGQGIAEFQLRFITVVVAVKTLRHLADTGEVQW